MICNVSFILGLFGLYKMCSHLLSLIIYFELMVLLIFMLLILVVSAGSLYTGVLIVYMLIGVVEGVLGIVILVILLRGSGESFSNLFILS